MTYTNEIERVGNGSGTLLKADTKGRVWVPREKREEVLREFDRSAMSGVAFAKWAGIKYTTLAGWLKQRRNQSSGDTSLKKKEVKWVEAVVPAVGGGVMIHLPSGVRVQVSSGKAAAEFLRELGVKTC